MKKHTIFIAFILILLVLTGCAESNKGSVLKVSTVYSNGGRSRSMAIPENYELTTDEDYNSLLFSHITDGEEVASVTPSFIFLGLNNLEFFNTEDNQENIFNTNGQYARIHNDYNITVNMLSTKGLSTYESELSKLNKAWHHLTMVFTDPWVGRQASTAPEPYNDAFSMSIVGVKIPEGIDRTEIKNTVDNIHLSAEERSYLSSLLEPLNGDDYVWFQFKDLIPLNFHYPAAVVFSDTITKTRIYHLPAGNDTPSNYCIGNGNPNDSSNMSIIEIPVETMDFSGVTNPEVEISYFAENLIRFYKDGDDYYAYFNPSDPFPISVDVKEAQTGNADYTLDEEQVTSTDIADAVPYFCNYNRYYGEEDYITLQFTMPNHTGITGVEIYHNAEDNLDAADLIFSGSACVYRHRMSDIMGDHFYWIRSVAADGSKSDFKAFREGLKLDKSELN